MKTIKLIILSTGFAFAALSVHAQAFQNLNFEQADPISAGVPGEPFDVTAASALPFWTAYLGNVQQTEVLQNVYSLGQASVDIFGPNYPSAGPSPGIDPGIIDGNYSVFIQAGSDPQNSTVLVSASIEQTGLVPVGSESLEFKAWQNTFTEFSVSFDGNNLSPVMLGTGANYTLYGVDIAPFAGQTGPLEFTATVPQTGLSLFGLDDITFVLTPEPSIVALAAIGGLLFGARKWFARH